MAQSHGPRDLSLMGNVRLWHMLLHHTELTGCRSFMIISRCTLILTCKLNSLGCTAVSHSVRIVQKEVGGRNFSLGRGVETRGGGAKFFFRWGGERRGGGGNFF